MSNLALDIEYEKGINVKHGMTTPSNTDYILGLKTKRERKVIQRDTLRWVLSNS
jgi:hypothetical protein